MSDPAGELHRPDPADRRGRAGRLGKSRATKAALVIGSASLTLMGGAPAAVAGAGAPAVAGAATSVESMPVPRIRTIEGYAFPLDEYRPSGAERARLTNAERALIGACMRAYGFPGRFTGGVPTSAAPLPRDRRYMFIDPALAAVQGYADVPRDARPASVKLSADERAVLTGRGRRSVRGKAVPAGGCAGRARRTLAAGTSRDDATLVGRLEAIAYDQAASSPLVAEATSAWRACMRRAGYAYTTPDQAWLDPRWGAVPDGAPPPSEEIATSTADMRCKLQVNYLGVRAWAEADAQRRLIDRNRDALRAYRENLRVRLDNAGHVLHQ